MEATVWWLWWLWFEHVCNGHVSVDMKAQRMHLLRVVGHLGVRLRATPPHRALDDEELFVVEGSQTPLHSALTAYK